jgi:hypothetical protein
VTMGKVLVNVGDISHDIVKNVYVTVKLNSVHVLHTSCLKICIIIIIIITI